MLDTCQHISMLGNHCRVLPAILLNITALLARIAQTITKIYRSKITFFVLFPSKKLVVILLPYTIIYSALINVLHQAGRLGR